MKTILKSDEAEDADGEIKEDKEDGETAEDDADEDAEEADKGLNYRLAHSTLQSEQLIGHIIATKTNAFNVSDPSWKSLSLTATVALFHLTTIPVVTTRKAALLLSIRLSLIPTPGSGNWHYLVERLHSAYVDPQDMPIDLRCLPMSVSFRSTSVSALSRRA